MNNNLLKIYPLRKKKVVCIHTWKASWIKTDFLNTVGPCLVRFCVVWIWIVWVLKNTPDLHSAYYGFLAFSDHLYYSGTCVVRFYIVWFCIVHTFFGILRAHYARTYCIQCKVFEYWRHTCSYSTFLTCYFLSSPMSYHFLIMVTVRLD